MGNGAPCRIRVHLHSSASQIHGPHPASYPLAVQTDQPGTVSVADTFPSDSAAFFLTQTNRVAIVPRLAD